MTHRNDFIKTIIKSLPNMIETELKTALNEYEGDTYLRVFIDLDPAFLNVTEIVDAIKKIIAERGLFIRELSASSDTFPKTFLFLSFFEN